ncbi:MAG TPA: protein kinase [Gemmatimonadales bacterium]|jgi:serine/threonine-protein kinase|nr:protein kinase [Gemmatimonadales bacterium]
MSEILTRLSTVLAARYELERQLGEGGMATVYLARDLKHGRNVAIKVLRPELAARLGSDRFVQEIKVTANLQHPNILPLFDSGAAEEFLYYVMPYVDGESLRAKLEHDRQLSLEETIAIAKAVAAALEYAHQHGIVHRDIKPENVLLQHGQALVADFGIALAVSAAGGGGERLTEAGISVGTPNYMSPEQASGDRAVDARSDIYALGALTYEMLTGDPPHHASTIPALVAKIMSEKPSPISRSRELVPANVDAAVQRALAKSPADRFARAAHFAEALTNPGFRLPITGEVTSAAPTPAPAQKFGLLAGGFALLGLGLVAGWVVARARAPRAAPQEAGPAVFYLPPDSGTAVPGYPAVSPDGSVLVYPGGDAGSNRLFLRRLRDPAPAPIPGTEGANSAFFSADGAWIGFLADQSLKKVRLEDGAEGIIAPYVEAMAGATWGEADTILFSALPRGSLLKVPAKGGSPTPLVIARQQLDSGFYFPQYLPGGGAIVFNTLSTGGQLGVLDLKTGKRKTFGRGLRPSYIESGQLVFANPEGRLVSQAFDLDRLELAGEASVLPEDLGVGRGRAFYSVSRGGVLGIIRSAGTALDLSLYDRAGKQQVLLRNASWAPRFSPDGNLIAYGDGNPDDLWIYDLRTQTRRRFTLDGASSNDPAWSPDGKYIAFSVDRPSRKDLLVRASDGTGDERQLVVREGLQWPSDWTRTGYIVYTDVPLDEDRDIWVVKADGSEPPFAYLDTPFLEKGGDVSPDGRWIAYDSNAPGRFEVFVNTFPKPSASPVIVSSAGGRNPRWGPDGRELFYWNEDRLIAVRLDLSGRPRVVNSSTILKASYASADHPNYDVHPDGRRFVIVTGRARPQRIIVAINPFSAPAPRR